MHAKTGSAVIRSLVKNVGEVADGDATRAFNNGYRCGVEEFRRNLGGVYDIGKVGEYSGRRIAESGKREKVLRVSQVNSMDGLKARGGTFDVYLMFLRELSPMKKDQRDLLKFYFKEEMPFRKLDHTRLAFARKEFQDQRTQLIQNWRVMTATSSLRMTTPDWHHVIPLAFGGPNSWFNLVPMRRKDHLQVHQYLSGSAQNLFPATR
ncbi:hypothetical protein NDN08_001475 [Rhodosorus marinus]|uniref:HNH nuclease domain-containing protein n=1 Tax=Rhodosorus marinus TaxID=101924 RepID=A0AAV8UTQ3_9RHOD|nr:hypothetical protein NDN08_001475 [Rhodosorus marinus]